MYCDNGYGAICTNITWKKNASQMLASKFTGTMRLFFESDLEDYRFDHPDATEDEFAPIFVDEYENHTYLWGGILGALVDVINENEFNEAVKFRVADTRDMYGELAIYVSAEIPEDETERDAIMTKTQIRNILAEYICPLIEDGMHFDYVDVVECD